MYLQILIISAAPALADPCLGQGRGGVWNLLCHGHGPHIPATIGLVCVFFAVCHASSASNAPRQLPRPNLPAGLSKATLAATRPRQCFKPFHKPFQGNSRSYRPHRGNSPSYRPQTSASNAPRQLPRSNLPAGLSKATLAATRPRQCFKPFHRPFQGNSRSWQAP